MKMVVATKNKGKTAEFSRILAPLGIEVKSMGEIGVDLEIDETGSTFEQNAYLKAKALFDEIHLPVLSDDSGIEVDALQGAPGVRTARYAGEHATDEENIELLLHNMQNISPEQRTARFVCSICVVLSEENYFFVTKTCEGTIGYEPKGFGGFGYDPIFMIGDQSFAELSDQEKDKISHRGKASRELVEKLKNKV